MQKSFQEPLNENSGLAMRLSCPTFSARLEILLYHHHTYSTDLVSHTPSSQYQYLLFVQIKFYLKLLCICSSNATLFIKIPFLRGAKEYQEHCTILNRDVTLSMINILLRRTNFKTCSSLCNFAG